MALTETQPKGGSAGLGGKGCVVGAATARWRRGAMKCLRRILEEAIAIAAASFVC